MSVRVRTCADVCVKAHRFERGMAERVGGCVYVYM